MIKKLTALFLVLWAVALIRFSVSGAASLSGKTQGEEQVLAAFAELQADEKRADLEVTGEWTPSEQDSQETLTGRLSWFLDTSRMQTDQGVSGGESENDPLNSQSGNGLQAGQSGWIPETQIESVLRTAASDLGLPQDVKISRKEMKNGTRWAVCREENPEVSLTMLAIRDGLLNRYYMQALVSTAWNSGTAADGTVTGSSQILAEMRRMEAVRRDTGLDGVIFLRMSAVTEKPMDQKEKEQLTGQFLRDCGAEAVETGQDGNLTMVYAYQEGMKQSLKLGEKPITMNLVFRNDEEKTTLFIGLPAVLSDDRAEPENVLQNTLIERTAGKEMSDVRSKKMVERP